MYQESALSSRTVSLCGNEVVWECKKAECRDIHFYRIKRTKTYVAPTWYWALIAVENESSNQEAVQWLVWEIMIYPCEDQEDRLFTIEEITCKVEGDNTFGAVSSGILRVRGRKIPARDVCEVISALDSNKDHKDSSRIHYAKEHLDVDGWQPEYDCGKTFGLLVTKTNTLPETGIAMILHRSVKRTILLIPIIRSDVSVSLISVTVMARIRNAAVFILVISEKLYRLISSELEGGLLVILSCHWILFSYSNVTCLSIQTLFSEQCQIYFFRIRATKWWF